MDRSAIGSLDISIPGISVKERNKKDLFHSRWNDTTNPFPAYTGGDSMNTNLCLFERVSKTSIAIVLLAFAIVFAISGLTVFPVFGVIVAIPFFLVSIYFFVSHLSGKCELE